MIWLRTRFSGALIVFVALASSSCTMLRELPRSEYAARPERPRVRVETTEGLVYEFDYARIDADSLTGYRERDVEGPINEISTLRIPLEGVRKLSVREIDWYRTGLVSGGALAAILAAGLTAAHHNNGSSAGASGGGKVLPGQ